MSDCPTGVEPSAIPIVLVPGLLCDARVWGAVERRLKADTVHVDLDGAASLEAMAERILAVPHERFVLAGFSMGGMAALLAAASAPGRIKGLAILSTHAERDPPERVRARLDQIAEVEAHGLRAFVTARLLPLYFDPTGRRADDCALVLDMALRKSAAVFRVHVQALAGRPDLAAAAASLGCPCEVLVGDGDRIATSAVAKRLADLIPGAKFHLLAGCGHVAPLDRPDEIAHRLTQLAARAAAKLA